MMKKTSKKIVIGLFVAAIVSFVSVNAHAYGENGCRWNPSNPVGICLKNTESTWDCYDMPPEAGLDCTASN